MIAIIDYEMGNLRSVQKGFEKVGHSAIVTSDAAQIRSASRVVLPGVGAFEDAMDALKRRDLIEPILEQIQSGKPFLGICLGLQLLFEKGFEGGEHEGLGLLAGTVNRFELPESYKVPHMGWNQIKIRQSAPILETIADGGYFYFVHSYFVAPSDDSCVALETDYGVDFCSMIWRDNLYATQFHPEKSQELGLRILKNFAELS
ncbi:MAG: imidazole glycerol phosphate synthase subunit HisH [Planctomycetaceae bacterium]|nr:imidazole glycerol phosphate synthase subunit HisH [Planctomycetaceae bacterium]